MPQEWPNKRQKAKKKRTDVGNVGGMAELKKAFFFFFRFKEVGLPLIRLEIILIFVGVEMCERSTRSG